MLAACTTPAPLPQPPTTQVPGIPVALKNADGTYRNLPGSPRAWKIPNQPSFFRTMFFGGVDRSPTVPPGHVISASKAALQWQNTPGDKLQWLGHSAFRWQLGSTILLTDPLLTDRASPFLFAGPKRYVPSPLKPEDTHADLILISHNHYDHLDLRTLRRLPNKATVTVIVPSGTADLVRNLGIPHVIELSWGQQVTFRDLTITFVPSIHFAARWLNDRNEALWGGYTIKSPHGNYYVAGDTAYHPTLFKQIGAALGPFDLALVPIGAYEPRNIMIGAHVNPEEAVQIGADLGARTLVGQHWGALVLTTEPAFEPPVRFRAAAAKAGYAPEHTWVMAVGETRRLPPAK